MWMGTTDLGATGGVGQEMAGHQTVPSRPRIAIPTSNSEHLKPTNRLPRTATCRSSMTATILKARHTITSSGTGQEVAALVMTKIENTMQRRSALHGPKSRREES